MSLNLSQFVLLKSLIWAPHSYWMLKERPFRTNVSLSRVPQSTCHLRSTHSWQRGSQTRTTYECKTSLRCHSSLTSGVSAAFFLRCSQGSHSGFPWRVACCLLTATAGLTWVSLAWQDAITPRWWPSKTNFSDKVLLLWCKHLRKDSTITVTNGWATLISSTYLNR